MTGARGNWTSSNQSVYFDCFPRASLLVRHSLALTSQFLVFCHLCSFLVIVHTISHYPLVCVIGCLYYALLALVHFIRFALVRSDLKLFRYLLSYPNDKLKVLTFIWNFSFALLFAMNKLLQSIDWNYERYMKTDIFSSSTKVLKNFFKFSLVSFNRERERER